MSSRKAETDGRIDLPDGRWVRMRPQNGYDMIALGDDDLSAITRQLAEAVVEQSWDGDVLEEPWPVLRFILNNWRRVTEEMVLPPAAGESSP